MCAFWDDYLFVNRRTDDPFYSKLVRMYRARAYALYCAGGVLLLATLFIVGIGIYLFVTGDRGDEMLANEEITAQRALDDVNRQLDELATSRGQITQELSVLERAKLLAERLKTSVPSMLSFIDELNEESANRTLRLYAVNLQIIQHVAGKGTDPVVIDVDAYSPDDTGRFPAASIDAIRKAAADAKINNQLLAEEINALVELVQQIKSTSPGPDGKFQSDLLPQLTKRLDESAELAKTARLGELIATRHRQAADAVQNTKQSASAEEQKRLELEKQARDLSKQLEEVRTKRNKILFMAWLPGLTLRVGAVVLLLFLTQIFLSTYRYTIAMGGFYLARADTIQLLQCNPDTHTYEMQELRALTEALTPGQINIDPVTDPTDHVAGLVKAWVEKRP